MTATPGETLEGSPGSPPAHDAPAAAGEPLGADTLPPPWNWPVAPPAQRYPLEFTGSGSEYFRIWVVNVLLTVLTVGIYSPWAKVRKTRYFWQSTRLDGHVFDYHGNPVAILRGRLLALGLLVAYTFGFDVSVTAGLATIAVVCLCGPWLFVRAQQFKYRNTSHRGLRFDFDADLAGSYRRLLPLLVIWFSGSVAGAFVTMETIWVSAVIGLATAFLIPWMHHSLKAFQHASIRFGGDRSRFKRAVGRFYLVYLFGSIIAGGMGVIAGLLVTPITAALRVHTDASLQSISYLTAFAFGLAIYTFVWPYFAARLQETVWNNTSLPPVRFEVRVRAGRLFLLVLKNVGLTLVTAGLYWPFAAVALARFRVQSATVVSDGRLDDLAGEVAAAPTPATGEGAADLFGLDIGI